jgi:hypothetical protein
LIARWLTQRCRDDDVPKANQVRPGLARLLEEQYPASPLTEVFNGRTRADTWTWHHGRGRGVVWLDRDRQVLWLLCFADEHDGGYDLGHYLVDEDPDRDRLYPKLDPSYVGTSTAPWGDYPDDDALEWIRFVHGAAEFFRDRSDRIAAGQTEEWKRAGFIRLAGDGEFLTMTVGNRLIYDDRASDRDRKLSNREVEEIFLQLTGDLDEELWQAHVPPYLTGAVNFLFVPPQATPDEWLELRIAEIVAGNARRGVEPSRV